MDSGDAAVDPVKSRDSLSGNTKDTSYPDRDDVCGRRLCNWFHSVDKNDRCRESLGGNYIRGNAHPL